MAVRKTVVVDVLVLVGNLNHFDDSQSVLRDVKERLGAAAFGQVLLYHLDNRTSLMGQCKVLTSGCSLPELGMSVADLGWPNASLHPLYRNYGFWHTKNRLGVVVAMATTPFVSLIG